MTFGNESTASDADTADSPAFLTPSLAEATKKVTDEIQLVRDEFRQYSGILVPSSSLTDFGPTNVQSVRRKMDTISTYPADQLRQMLMAEYMKTDELERRLELYDGRSKVVERKLFQSEHVMKLQWELLLKLENSLTDTLNGLNTMEKRRIAACTELKATERQNKRTIAQLTSERDAYFGEKENLARHVNNLKKSGTDAAGRITELEDEVNGLRRQMDHFQTVQQELDETQARERELRKQCKDQRADVQRYEHETSTLQTQVAQLEEHLRQTTAAYEQKLAELRIAANESNAGHISAEREKYSKKLNDMDKTFVKALDEAKKDNKKFEADNMKLKEALRALTQGQQEWKRKEYRRLKQNILEEYTAFIGRVASKKESFNNSPWNRDFTQPASGQGRDMATHFLREYLEHSNMSDASSASSVADQVENRPPPANPRQSNAGGSRSRSVDPVHRQRLRNVLQNALPQVVSGNRRSTARNN